MLNQIILVGRLYQMKDRDGSTIITLAVPRSFKNSDGEYETDYIDIFLYNSVAENTKEYVRNGDIIGIKGRIQTKEVGDIKITMLVAEKVTFLSSKQQNENKEEHNIEEGEI